MMWTQTDEGQEIQLFITYSPYQPATRWEPEEGEFLIDRVLDSNGERIYLDLTDRELARFEREYLEWLEGFNAY